MGGELLGAITTKSGTGLFVFLAGQKSEIKNLLRKYRVIYRRIFYNAR